MTGESMSRDRIVRDIERQTARPSHVTIDEITALYAPQILATARPTRPNHSPD